MFLSQTKKYPLQSSLLFLVSTLEGAYQFGNNRSIFVDENLVVFSDKVLGKLEEGRLRRGSME